MNRTRILMLVALALTLALVGCNEDEETTIIQPVQLAPQVQALIVADGPRRVAGPGESRAFVSVSAYPVIPEASINGTALSIDPELTLYSGGIGFSAPIAASQTGTNDLLVDFGDVVDSGTASIPALGFSDVVGDYDINVVPGHSAVLTWTTAANAECYWVQCYFETGYGNEEAKTTYWENRFTTFVTDTTLTLTAADMHPADVAYGDITYFYGDVDVMPVVGPIQAGDLPNIEGCDGVLVGLGQDMDWDLELAIPGNKGDDAEREQTINPLDLLRR